MKARRFYQGLSARSEFMVCMYMVGSHVVLTMFPLIHQGGWLKFQNRKWGGPILFLSVTVRLRFLENRHSSK